MIVILKYLRSSVGRPQKNFTALVGNFFAIYEFSGNNFARQILVT